MTFQGFPGEWSVVTLITTPVPHRSVSNIRTPKNV